ncbi:hypothetical protein M406DRAFT_347447 [Cryphonectria parasitica EP155]|uniref:Archaemetzincin-2 n=1 Tax=Cryphonectria parasitica (strain ATCC 38755 / EP155) TaxID=660469 RepID=A0A9P4XWJ1_CRYP1|nr:uncharacterized protein M406DRAFT_347447 [Cryphonectria parasitica EP155]KAF3762313.1 hypothetical protein M406DRAFT_347447 [Cryphonectria parasitica EP155]
MAPRQKKCIHPSLTVDVSPHGAEAGYKRPDWKRRAAATTSSGRFPWDGPKEEPASHLFTFPAPLVLPDDDLAQDPGQPPQSLRSWHNMPERNHATCNRKTVYVARPPAIPESLSVMSKWIEPAAAAAAAAAAVQPPKADDILAYLGAFYHGFEVREYNPTLRFEPWEDNASKGNPTSFVALKEGPADSLTRIRARPSLDGVFSHQLNLNDMLDCAIRILPRDAYALLLLVDHDLYEDEDDDFCCGRAYGGSRVAVVSSARYSPLCHAHEGVDTSHIWPASHCAAYVASQCLWLFCLARTASHELGHCFGMAHCMYYACVMQSTAGVAEDCRQPPYLCPVCAEKLSVAAGEAHGPLVMGMVWYEYHRL